MNTNDFIRKEDGKIVIPVPAGIRYMSEWVDFNLNFFGNQPYIIDKQIPGCGFTEYCLTNGDDIILTSPRKMLLDNKLNQHLGDIHYFKNECDDSYTVDKDLTKFPSNKSSNISSIEESRQKSQEENHKELTVMELKLLSYLNERQVLGKPFKIIVTYDSFKHVKRFLMKDPEIFKRFKVVVDEFQSIFVDSRFKASTEFGFLTELRDLNNPICFVSATPMMDKYLMKLDYFKGLPYFELNWGMKDPARVMKPELKVRKTQSINSELKRIIKDYKNGDFAILANPITGSLIQSREAVFYVNSVNNILSVIKAEGLKPDEVNILCSDTADNRDKIKKRLGAKYQIGRVPLRGEYHKMFTFCTRTVYLGADFYSLCARTFILSDANIDSLAVDISLDLPQILGRQRLIENPWKNHAEFYFKNLGNGKEILRQEFDKVLKRKLKKTENKLSVYSKSSPEEKMDLISDYKVVVSVMNYQDDYISIDYNYSGDYLYPVKNELVLIAEQRAFDIQQIDYKDRFSVFSTLRTESGFKFDSITRFIDHLRDTSIPMNLRLKELCETEDFTEEEKKVIAQQASEKFDKFYNLAGPERCRAHGYITSDIYREIEVNASKDNITIEFYKEFKVNGRYTNKEAKEKIGNIYKRLGLYKNPKATDLLEFFEVKKVSIFLPDKSKVNGLEILNTVK